MKDDGVTFIWDVLLTILKMSSKHLYKCLYNRIRYLDWETTFRRKNIKK